MIYIYMYISIYNPKCQSYHQMSPYYSFHHAPRSMISNAKEWAIARGLCRKNEIHKEDEFRVPTVESFAYTHTKTREAEATGSMDVMDDDRSLLNFGDMSAEQTMLCLGSELYVSLLILMNTTFFQKTCLNMIIPFPKSCTATPCPEPRRGANSGTVNSVAASSTAAARVQSLPMLQSNQDPFGLLSY